MALLYLGMAPKSRAFPFAFGNANSSGLGGAGGGASAIFGLSDWLVQPGRETQSGDRTDATIKKALNFDFIG